MAIKLADTLAPMADFPAAMAEHIEFNDGKNLQEVLDEGIIGGVELTQAEYDALTDEEKKNGLEYRCTDSGRIYINDVLYSRKKEVELETYEEYKALEEAGLVEADVDYVVHSNQSGVLLSDLDINHGDSEISTYEVIEELKSDVSLVKDEIANKSLPNIYSVTTDFDYITHYCLKDVLKVSNDRELTLLLLTRGGEEMRIVIGKDNTTYKINAYKTVENYNKILNVYSYNDTDLYITLATYSNFLKVYLMSGEISDTFSGQNIGRTLPDGVVEIPIIKNALASEIVGTKTQYRGSRSIDITTGGKLTLIFSSEYASQAGCYMLLSNFNTEPLLIELGRNNIGQFSVTATHKSQNVDTITVTAAGDEYSWCVLQF